MYQQSTDRSHGSARSDLILFIALVAAFFTVGAVVLYLENKFSSRLPRYIFIAAVLGCLFLVYKFRLVGYRYTVFYEAPRPVYDEKLGETIIHEDYPYPLGTVVFECIVSAKGTIVYAVDRKDIKAFLKPGESAAEFNFDKELNLSCIKAEKAHALIFEKDGKLIKVLFDPDEEFLGHLNTIMDPSYDPSPAADETPLETDETAE